MKNVKTLIACPVFKDELAALLPRDSEIVVNTLNYRIHDNSKFMKQELVTTISKAKNTGTDICILLGCECNCDTHNCDKSFLCHRLRIDASPLLFNSPVWRTQL